MKCAIFWSPNTHCAFCFQLTTGFFTRRYVDNSRKVVVWTDHFARLLEQLPQSYFRGQGVCEKIKSISTALFGGQDSSSSNLNQIAPNWSNPMSSDPFWLNPVWSSLIQFNPMWSNFFHFYPETDRCTNILNLLIGGVVHCTMYLLF